MDTSSDLPGYPTPIFIEEAVELRLRKRKRPLRLDRVLRRDDEERLGKGVRLSVDGHLRLRHAFEQGGLSARRRAVDLVGEQNVGKDGARAKHELLRLLVVNGEPRDVRRQKVRSELDAFEMECQASRERPREHRLAGAGNVLDQEMTFAEQGHERELDHVRLPDDHALHVGFDALDELGGFDVRCHAENYTHRPDFL